MKTDIEKSITRKYRQKVFSKRHAASMERERVKWLLAHSYNSAKFWAEYLTLYQDLFTLEEDAIRKAKTHSLALMCRQIRNRSGCSLQFLYSCVLREIVDSRLIIDEGILKVTNKLEFIDSLFEI